MQITLLIGNKCTVHFEDPDTASTGNVRYIHIISESIDSTSNFYCHFPSCTKTCISEDNPLFYGIFSMLGKRSGRSTSELPSGPINKN